ncbi:glycosyltransferase [Alicyclobacillus tengchongensis]|nr:glycosyltransferase [Alicyclobacillus tengchongensis]
MRISVVIPVFNEEAVIRATYERLTAVMQSVGVRYELIFVNDGSSDASASMIVDLAKGDQAVKLLNFSRNFGHQIAISAGMDHAMGDAVIVIDADLQDPPELIPDMIKRWEEGFDVVYAKRVLRHGETWFKRFTAAAFYRALRALTEIDIPVDTGDFRLIDRKVCDVLRMLPEHSRFVRGLVAWSGFRQCAIEYVRQPRFAGETKYPLKRMLRLAFDAITSFSEKPLRWTLYAGLITFGLSVCALIAFLIAPIFTHRWSVVALVLASGGLLNSMVLVGLGIVGQYLGRLYDEARGRPLYILDHTKS